ncbi:hypothetical protein O181_046445 [Austropuccinia psidii MF-1]|uniref:Uncharacterized protein n=1 Tax=Austropuccinia psidii MF-1 TaxID=1389203 RepID=A0A9Q3DNI5_9BASI|nr:hypothetical protein [Austropuccinia psidii MF-1]
MGHQSRTLPSQPAYKIFKSQIKPSIPRIFQPVLSTIPPLSPNPFIARPVLASPLRPFPIEQPISSPIVTSKPLQPVARARRRIEERSPFPFPAAQVFQRRGQWPVSVNQEDSNMVNEGQDSVARLFRRVDSNSSEVIMYANDRMIPGTASEEIAAKFA